MSASPRIPLALQAVFLASNRGHEVTKPPPRQVANKVFSRVFRRSTTTQAESNKVRQPADGIAEDITPQQYLDNLLESRGYSRKRYKTLGSAYHNDPTKLQLASFDGQIIKMILRRYQDEEALRATLASGISPNACNQYGESLIHKVCRRGDCGLLDIFVECGADFQISDDAGRTPMHDACWGAKPSFGVIEILMKHDIRMFHLKDKGGYLPLSYVREGSRKNYINFFDSVKDVYWPMRNVTMDGEEQPPPLALQKPNSRRIPDPENALSPEYAKMVASGRLTPEDAQSMFYVEGKRRYSPLSYVREGSQRALTKFFGSMKDVYWPMRNTATDGKEKPPPLPLEKPNSRSIPDPAIALPPEYAKMAASGRLAPADAQLKEAEEEEDEDYVESATCDESSSYSSDDDSKFDWDDDMVAGVMQLTQSCSQQQQQPALESPTVPTTTVSPAPVPTEVSCTIVSARAHGKTEMYFL
jgi:hypothetical protein